MKKWWLGFIGRHLNPTTLRLAREGAPVEGGFIAELTYGDDVQWYQNLIEAGGGIVVRGGVETRIVAIVPYDTKKGRAAFGAFARVVLTLLRRREFRFLRAA